MFIFMAYAADSVLSIGRASRRAVLLACLFRDYLTRTATFVSTDSFRTGIWIGMWCCLLVFVLNFHCATQFCTTRTRIVNVVNGSVYGLFRQNL